jgi:hypothetical protein
MNANRQTAVSTGDTHTDNTMTANLIRWTGLAAVGAGTIFAAIQPIHPPDVVASVTTNAWAVITTFKTVMCMLFLLGIGGIYARQANKAGWLGLAGWLLFSLSWTLQTAFVFAEGYILPLLANDAPEFVNGVLGISSGQPSPVDLGALPLIYNVGVGGLYMLGGLVFGIATYRAHILPRWAAGLMAVTAIVLTPAAAMLPHAIQRFAAVPMGVALIGLGYGLWAERHTRATEPVQGRESLPISQPATK